MGDNSMTKNSNDDLWRDYLDQLPVIQRDSYDAQCNCVPCQSVRDDFREWAGNYTISDDEIKGYPMTGPKRRDLSYAEVAVEFIRLLGALEHAESTSGEIELGRFVVAHVDFWERLLLNASTSVGTSLKISRAWLKYIEGDSDDD
jgi:hypothetical protein